MEFEAAPSRIEDTSSVRIPQAGTPVNLETPVPTTAQLNIILPKGSEVVLAAMPAEPGSRPTSPQLGKDSKRLRVVEGGLLKCPGAAAFWIQAEGFPLNYDWDILTHEIF